MFYEAHRKERLTKGRFTLVGFSDFLEYSQFFYFLPANPRYHNCCDTPGVVNTSAWSSHRSFPTIHPSRDRAKDQRWDARTTEEESFVETWCFGKGLWQRTKHVYNSFYYVGQLSWGNVDSGIMPFLENYSLSTPYSRKSLRSVFH